MTESCDIWRRAAVIALALSLPVAPVAGQAADQSLDQDASVTDRSQVSAEEALAKSRKVYGPPVPLKDCGEASEEAEIVVCAEEEDQSEFRVQSTTELDPESPEALDDGIPRAPGFKPPPCVPSLLTLCSKFGGAARAPVEFDITKLPEAPEGSDADLIAKGLKGRVKVE